MVGRGDGFAGSRSISAVSAERALKWWLAGWLVAHKMEAAGRGGEERASSVLASGRFPAALWGEKTDNASGENRTGFHSSFSPILSVLGCVRETNCETLIVNFLYSRRFFGFVPGWRVREGSDSHLQRWICGLCTSESEHTSFSSSSPSFAVGRTEGTGRCQGSTDSPVGITQNSTALSGRCQAPAPDRLIPLRIFFFPQRARFLSKPRFFLSLFLFFGPSLPCPP